MTLNCFERIKMEFQKLVNLLDTTSDDKDLPRFVTKNWTEVYVQSVKNYNVKKEITIKTPMLRSDLSDFNDACIVMKGIVAVTDPDNAKTNKAAAFKNNAPFINCISKTNGIHIDNAEDLDVVMPVTICLNTAKITEKQQVVCGIITEINQGILFLLTLNLLNTRQVLREILIILVLVMLVMMQAKSVKMKLKLLFL